MIHSTLNPYTATRNVISTFMGLNHNLKTQDGQFYDMKNMTSSHYPLLSPRIPRGRYVFPESDTPVQHKINGIVYKDCLIYVDGCDLYVDNYRIPGLILEDSEKQLISMGAYLIILPDKKWINTKDLTDYGDIEASYTSDTKVSFTMCRIDGTEYENVIKSATEPSDPENMQYWIDTSTKPHTLKLYSATNSMWSSVPTSYIKVSAPGIGQMIERYDACKMTGIKSEQMSDQENKVNVIYEVKKTEDGAGDYIVIVGFLDEVFEQDEPITIKRRMPKMDFVIESGNRLWGCRYGTNLDGDVVNEIYCSKLGDFKNWECYMGLSTDSYAVSCGTDGQWTGAITHLGYPTFFKEQCMHKVYGAYPAQYQVQQTTCRGVQKGAGRSLAIVNETLYYKSRNGVCAYDGSLPAEITTAFGDVHYSGLDKSDGYDPYRCGAVAGVAGSKYYCSMLSEKDNKWYMMVFDANYGTWHIEDNMRADQFCSGDGEVYFINHDDKQIYTVNGSGNPYEGQVDWMVETGNIGIELVDRKYISRLMVRMSMAIGSRCMFYVQHDSSGEWEHLTTFNSVKNNSFSFPIKPKRCDHFKLRIVGSGDVKIFNITETIEKGSDR